MKDDTNNKEKEKKKRFSIDIEKKFSEADDEIKDEEKKTDELLNLADESEEDLGKDLSAADISLVKEEESPEKISEQKSKIAEPEEAEDSLPEDATKLVQEADKEAGKPKEEKTSQEKEENGDQEEEKARGKDDKQKIGDEKKDEKKPAKKAISDRIDEEKKEKESSDIFEFAKGLPKHLDDRSVKQALAKEGYSGEEIDKYFSKKEDVNAFDVIESDNAMKTIYMLNFVLFFLITLAFLFTNRPVLHYYIVIPCVGVLLSLLMIHLNRKFLGKPNYITLYGAYLPVYGLFTIYLPIVVIDYFRDGIEMVLESLQGIMPIQPVLGKSFNPMFLMLLYLLFFNLPIIVIALSKRCFNRKDLMHYSIAIFLYIIGMLGISWFLTFFA